MVSARTKSQLPHHCLVGREFWKRVGFPRAAECHLPGEGLCLGGCGVPEKHPQGDGDWQGEAEGC